MSTGAIANPFDAPLPGEEQPTQAVQPKSASGTGVVNPFDAPLPGEEQPTLTPSQVAYRKATAAGPFTPAGQAEKAMGEAIGDRKAQEAQALHDVGQAALMTAGGVVGASALGAAPEVVPEIVSKAKAVAEWAKANPIKSFAIAQMAQELGVHPFDMLHSVVKYGKNLFGEGSTK